MKNRKVYRYSLWRLGCCSFPLACSKEFPEPAGFTRCGHRWYPVRASLQDGTQPFVNAIYDGFQHDNQSFVLKACSGYNANYCSQDWFNWGADVSYNTYLFPTDFAFYECLLGSFLGYRAPGECGHTHHRA